MSSARLIVTVIMVGAVTLVGWQCANADPVDWLGQCLEGDNLSDAIEQQHQKCGSLDSCADPIACRRQDGVCTTSDSTPTLSFDSRVINYGSCETVTPTNENDKCWYCDDPTSLICQVTYGYELFNAGACDDRCSEPSFKMTAGAVCKE